MSTEVRTITDSELDEYGACMGAAFLKNQGPEWAEFRRKVDMQLDRTFSAFEDGVLCGTARSFPTEVRLPGGGSASAAAVTQVTVRPTHRRRGHLTRMMAAQLGDVIDRGEALALLIAAEWPIYGRFGYGPATYWAARAIDTKRVALVDPSWHGSIDLVPAAVLRKVGPDIFAAHQQRTVGSITRDDEWWDVNLGMIPHPEVKDDPHEFRAVHRNAAGEPDGYIMWKTTDKWIGGQPLGEIEIQKLIAVDAGAYADMWQFITSVDLVVNVSSWGQPVDEPLPLLLRDGRAVRTTTVVDHIWARVLDVPAVLGARTYSAPGRVVLDIVDGQLGRGGRFALDGAPDGSTCTPTTDAPDLTMPIGSLGAICLGGTSLRRLSEAGQVDEHRAGTVDLAARMFSTPIAPWCSSSF
jgi:predicted acetyltransferase